MHLANIRLFHFAESDFYIFLVYGAEVWTRLQAESARYTCSIDMLEQSSELGNHSASMQRDKREQNRMEAEHASAK